MREKCENVFGTKICNEDSWRNVRVKVDNIYDLCSIIATKIHTYKHTNKQTYKKQTNIHSKNIQTNIQTKKHSSERQHA